MKVLWLAAPSRHPGWRQAPPRQPGQRASACLTSNPPKPLAPGTPAACSKPSRPTRKSTNNICFPACYCRTWRAQPCQTVLYVGCPLWGSTLAREFGTRSVVFLHRARRAREFAAPGAPTSRPAPAAAGRRRRQPPTALASPSWSSLGPVATAMPGAKIPSGTLARSSASRSTSSGGWQAKTGGVLWRAASSSGGRGPRGQGPW